MEWPFAQGGRIELKVEVVVMRQLVIVGMEHGTCSL
jgi:hypothetical protein